jgi:prepilin-type N-terminal cleavage/methylation domain-containing protein/prepilin-type processing-associated H-X9-DG protein
MRRQSTLRATDYRHTSSAFTLVELLVVIGIIGLLIAILIPTVNKAVERARRVKCASNLNQIGHAFRLYGVRNEGGLPRTITEREGSFFVANNTGFDQADPASAGTNNVCSSLFLLLRDGDLDPKVFNCPSTEAEPDDFGGMPRTQRSNFTEIPRNLSYSYNVPFPHLRAQWGYRYTDGAATYLKLTIDGLPSDYALAGDMNPGNTGGSPQDNVNGVKHNAPPGQIATANSNNHDGKGQNVLYGDGHVSWSETPFCGMSRPKVSFRDNIYTRDNTYYLSRGNHTADDPGFYNGTATPGDPYDSVLAPSDDPGGL